MRTLIHGILVTLCLLLAVSNALADKEVVITRIEGLAVQEPGPEILRQDCQVGNLNTPVWAINDWILGNEGYKLVFDPMATCDCPLGFHLQTVHMLMNFGAEDVPATFDVYADLEEAVFDEVSGCWLPGAEVCASPVYSVTIETAGLYDISLPIGDTCECADMRYIYLLSYHFMTAFPAGMEPDAVSDDIPTSCISYNDFGSGWLDLVTDFGWPGNIIMYADADCCEFPVSDEGSTWGGVKNLYRR